jgi:hypothetical protein
MGFGEGRFVEAVAEHLLDRAVRELDRAVREGADGECPATGRLHPPGAVAVGQADDAEHGAIALLEMGRAARIAAAAAAGPVYLAQLTIREGVHSA